MPRDLRERLASLYRIGQVISSSLVLDEVLSLVIDNLIEVTGAERGAILLFDARGDLIVRAARDLDRQAIAADMFRTSRNIVREVAQSGAARLIDDASIEFSGSAFQSVLEHQLRSILCAPLKARDAVRGVLYVDNRITSGAFTAEDLELLDAFAGQAAVAIENAQMVAELAKQERQRRDLEIARSIQASLMPSSMPPTPGFDVAASCVPAYQVGGDFYDAIATSTNELALVLGDVSGKGVTAALLTGMVRALLRSELGQLATLESAAQNCNRILYDDFSRTAMFTTLVLGRLDPRNMRFSYVNCGHCEPMLWRKRTQTCDFLGGDGLPLGILDEFVTHQSSVALEPGDILVIYSDGFSEAKAASGERFGLARLAQAVGGNTAQSARGIVDQIGLAVDRFAQTEPQSDDQTIIVVRAVD